MLQVDAAYIAVTQAEQTLQRPCNAYPQLELSAAEVCERELILAREPPASNVHSFLGPDERSTGWRKHRS
jgi:hypothetical protein